RPGVCKAPHDYPLPIALAASPQGLEALVGGSVISSLGTASLAAPNPGSAWSPDRKSLVLVSRLGLAVVGEHKELWDLSKLPADQADATRLKDCVVATDARSVACLRDGRALWFQRP